MSVLGLGLLYVGAVLLINGLGLYGILKNGREASIMNFFTGTLQFILAIYSATVLGLTYAAAQTLLFAFTYLWAGYNGYTGQEDQKGFGWYCLFVVAVALPISIQEIFFGGDLKLGIVWISWAILWFMFWLQLGLEKPIKKATAIFTLFNAILTGVVGFAMLNNWW
jgi:hypothetical protein